jgi:hypothetical protein
LEPAHHIHQRGNLADAVEGLPDPGPGAGVGEIAAQQTNRTAGPHLAIRSGLVPRPADCPTF